MLEWLMYFLLTSDIDESAGNLVIIFKNVSILSENAVHFNHLSSLLSFLKITQNLENMSECRMCTPSTIPRLPV